MKWLVPLRDSQEKINVLKEQVRDEQCWLVSFMGIIKMDKYAKGTSQYTQHVPLRG